VERVAPRVRCHRRSLRARLGRVGAIRPAALRPTQPATADRRAAAEDPHHRSFRLQCWLRAWRRRPDLDSAQPDDRGVPHREGEAGRV